MSTELKIGKKYTYSRRCKSWVYTLTHIGKKGFVMCSPEEEDFFKNSERDYFKEVRKPRVVYINKWDGGIGWGSVWDNPNDALFQKGSRTDVKTIKFIEVLD